jgi:hypothetical protein
MGRAVHLAITVLLAAACGYLVYANAQLRDRAESAPSTTATATSEPKTKDQESDDDSRPAGKRPGLLSRLAGRSRKRPQLEVPNEETREQRRRRRSEEMRALLGRDPGESEDEYIERLRPVVVAGLAEPRMRTGNARRAAEDAAEVSDEQRSEIDAILSDTYDEAMTLANQAIQSGDVSPYRRNWAGALQAAGGIGSVLQSTEERIGQVLSPEQRQIMYDAGFEWGEYIGANTPWENLKPPPPPPEP